MFKLPLIPSGSGSWISSANLLIMILDLIRLEVWTLDLCIDNACVLYNKQTSKIRLSICTYVFYTFFGFGILNTLNIFKISCLISFVLSNEKMYDKIIIITAERCTPKMYLICNIIYFTRRDIFHRKSRDIVDLNSQSKAVGKRELGGGSTPPH